MADLWNFIFFLLVAIAPIYLCILYFNSEKKDEEIRRRRTRISSLRKGVSGYRTKFKTFTREERKQVLLFTRGQCFYCCKDLTSVYWEVDHLWPVKKGGVNDLHNLVPSCKQCNKAKFIQNPFLWIVNKWGTTGSLNEFELRFLKHYSLNSPSNLTSNRYWDSYMKKVSTYSAELLNDVKNVKDDKSRTKIYETYKTKFGDYPEKWEVIE